MDEPQRTVERVSTIPRTEAALELRDILHRVWPMRAVLPIRARLVALADAIESPDPPSRDVAAAELRAVSVALVYTLPESAERLATLAGEVA